MSKLRVMSLFSGIGAFEAALRNIGVDYELIGFSEIDKYAIKSYCAIHNVSETLNVGDISKAKKDNIPYFDLLTSGFPCPTFSVAGGRDGMEYKCSNCSHEHLITYEDYKKGVKCPKCEAVSKAKDERGTLFFETALLAEEKKPKFVILENVKGLINSGNGQVLRIISETMNNIGYRIDLELLNSKFFNVPQNRERVYIIGIREDLVENEQWVVGQKRNDVLSKGKKRLQEINIKSFNFKWPLQDTVTKRLREILEDFVDEKYYLNEEKTKKLVEQLGTAPLQKQEVREPLMVGHVDLKGHDAIKRVYSPEGLSPTLTTMGGGHREPKIAEKQKEVRAVLTPEREEKRQNGRRFKENGEPAFTVNTIDRHGVAIGEYPKYKIRKLSPLECWRLQAFDDEDFEKAFAAGISNSQLYKQAGNSITVSVLESIFQELIHTYVNKESE
ncbi:DNA (cytosine-5-)-methyltransferase [Bacillus subtilis subsp. subtilis]|uniref:Orphan methyltransferase M.SPBetaI n=5 Tax=root TaxID=1 RepID=MTBB_BPSPB|nr:MULTISPECIES: DNA (cytosine-5-)-methyltransferase [Bacillales]NP_046694.1 DNA methyltransferase [Bacillus phage SPBc2]NP_389907.1 DNA (cytosine-5-)-methyltransferase; phage SPbeta [Bacillus subtilis subsp. subtilis str. 168]P09389.2 RecName: Full=Orphan methyltransferase M.SPBetaI; Short=M.SPBetaI; AltName: Full=Cytosine-specific methyltransferase SPBetaI; AltName: Full=Modification methylase SPBetaI [Bacillus phage SPBc2]P68585.1 RecName: Full=Putative type II methyltransferase M.BsuMIIP; S